mmetsp:Transcript_49477/g.140182  ORF Transcript_49477/g.140182 Transcript_49477/m.140182 type:complete len:1156 (+) Transcript_49477:108-3575(+)
MIKPWYNAAKDNLRPVQPARGTHTEFSSENVKNGRGAPRTMAGSAGCMCAVRALSVCLLAAAQAYLLFVASSRSDTVRFGEARYEPKHSQMMLPQLPMLSEGRFSRAGAWQTRLVLPGRKRGLRGRNGEGTAVLTVALISNNREASLRRLCDSLLAADYSSLGRFFDRVDIIFNLEASSDDGIVAYARGFHWPHGAKLVRKRAMQGGLILAVSESWFPSSPEDYGCLLEDDIEVSPHYFQFTSEIMLALQREPDPRVIGISLYSPRRTETTNPTKAFDSSALISELMGPGYRESPYMMQTPCSWGAVYFPNHWEEFVKYLQLRFDLMGTGAGSPHDVQIPRSRTNGWSGSWKKFHFELLYLKGQYLVYPNFEGQHSLSTNHMEKGEHIKAGDVAHKRQDFTVPLLANGAALTMLRSLNVSQLPVLNLFGEPWLREAQLEEKLRRAATDASLSNDRPRHQQPSLLAVGEELVTGDKLVSATSGGRGKQGSRSVEVYYAMVQNDGQFVIYRDAIMKGGVVSSPAQPVWSTKTLYDEVEGIGYRLSLVPTGSLKLEQVGATNGEVLGMLWFSPPDPIARPAGTGSYLAQLESDGNLAVYWANPCLTLVWEVGTAGRARRRGDPSMLSVGEELWNVPGDRLISLDDDNLKNGEMYHAAVQGDGNFVVYDRSKRDADSMPTAVWSTNTHTESSGSVGYRMVLSSTGSLRLEQMSKSSGEVLDLMWSSPSDPDTRRPGTGTYHAQLESDGNLAVYWADPCLALVWQSIRNKPHASRCRRRRCDRAEVSDHASCSQFPTAVPSLLQDASTFTLLISTHSRFELLSRQLSYYSASPVISTIVVTWHHMTIQPPPNAQIRGTLIRFESPSSDSLNNRFQPLLHITTAAVLVLDDDIKLHLQDVHNMFLAWKENKRNLVGVSPRWVDAQATPAFASRATAPQDLVYGYRSEDDTANPHEGYSLMLTRAMMMHRDYLRLYTCGGTSEGLNLTVSNRFDQLRSLILSIVEAEFNCEDIGMNFIVNAAMDTALSHGQQAAPLFVRPLHKIGDFGKMGHTGLHQKKSHVATRSDCVNQMNRALWRVTGRNLPVQTKLVDTVANRQNKSLAALSVRQYYGLTSRLHKDCFATVYDGTSDEACSWRVPRRIDYAGTYFTTKLCGNMSHCGV